MIYLIGLLLSVIFLIITVIAAFIQDDNDDIPKWLLYPLPVIMGGTCLYFLVRSIIGLFWTIVPYSPVIILFLAKIIFTIITDPVAATITIAGVLTILGLLEREYLFIYTLSEKARFHYHLWRSEQNRRDGYEKFRDGIKKGINDEFEKAAKKVIK